MKHYSESWSIELPDSWECSEEEGCTTFYNPNGVGALQISTYTKTDGDVTDQDLVEFAESDSLSRYDNTNIPGYVASYSDGEIFWRTWWLRFSNRMVFATYNCAETDIDKEATAIDEAISTIRPTQPPNE